MSAEFRTDFLVGFANNALKACGVPEVIDQV